MLDIVLLFMAFLFHLFRNTKMKRYGQVATYLLFASLIIHLTNSSDNDCPYTECSCSVPTIACEDLGLPAIPQLINISTNGLTNLIFAINHITTIPAGSLPPNLVSISFAGNPITTVEDTVFDGSAYTLKSLTFGNALFTRIPDALLHVHSLTSFSISESSITDWNDDVMKYIGLTVTNLNIDSVGLTVWPTWFQYFSHLTQLTISDSSISFIPDGAMDLIANSLTNLALDTNKLTIIPKAFSSLTSLQVLSMLENEITNVTWLPSASKLSALTFTNNKISDADQLSNALQPYAESLTDADFDNNMLTKIPDVYFLTRIGSVDLSHNRISDTISGSLPSALYELDLGYNSLPLIPIVASSVQLTGLYLSYNDITQIHGSDFSSSIIEVDLGHNLITELTVASFPTTSLIEIMRLDYNPITNIAIDAFSNLQITELYLGSTRLARLPLALGSLTTLRVLDITNTVPLVCTCLEKSLEVLLVNISEGDIRGDCGQTSIYDFLKTLSPSCPSADSIIVG